VLGDRRDCRSRALALQPCGKLRGGPGIDRRWWNDGSVAEHRLTGSSVLPSGAITYLRREKAAHGVFYEDGTKGPSGDDILFAGTPIGDFRSSGGNTDGQYFR